MEDLQTGHQAIRLETDIRSVAVSIEAVIPCGLVVNELISNAIEHGFGKGETGSIRVFLGPSDNGDIRLIIADNGAGLPPGTDSGPAAIGRFRPHRLEAIDIFSLL